MKIFYSQEILRDFIVANIKDNNDIILRYNNKLLRRRDQKSCGHFSLIISLDAISNKVTLGDPDLPHFKQASLEKIIYSMSDKIEWCQKRDIHSQV